MHEAVTRIFGQSYQVWGYEDDGLPAHLQPRLHVNVMRSDRLGREAVVRPKTLHEALATRAPLLARSFDFVTGGI